MSINDLGQLLWAMRGRTPHYYKSKPWGMTIPTSKGDQNKTSIFLIFEDSIFRYVNWLKGRPTNHLQKAADLKTEDFSYLSELEEPLNDLIILNMNEKSEKANWELGYQVLNFIAQL